MCVHGEWILFSGSSNTRSVLMHVTAWMLGTLLQTSLQVTFLYQNPKDLRFFLWN